MAENSLHKMRMYFQCMEKTLPIIMINKIGVIVTMYGKRVCSRNFIIHNLVQPISLCYRLGARETLSHGERDPLRVKEHFSINCHCNREICARDDKSARQLASKRVRKVPFVEHIVVTSAVQRDPFASDVSSIKLISMHVRRPCRNLMDGKAAADAASCLYGRVWRARASARLIALVVAKSDLLGGCARAALPLSSALPSLSLNALIACVKRIFCCCYLLRLCAFDLLVKRGVASLCFL